MVGSIEVKGFAELERALVQLGPTVAKKLLTSSVRKGANVIAREAKARAPIRETGQLKSMGRAGRKGVQRFYRKPGFLRASIGVRIKKAAASAGVPLVLSITTGKAFYASFMEFGTRHQPARPFMRPAAEAKFGEAVETIAKDLGPKIEAEFGKLAGGAR